MTGVQTCALPIWVGIFKLDDKSEPIEAVDGEALLDAHRDLLKDDELIIVQGKVKPDRFSGGLRLDVATVWSLPAARARFGRQMLVPLRGGSSAALGRIDELLRQHPPRVVADEQGETREGLLVKLQLTGDRAVGELELGEAARFWPADEALAGWRALAAEGQARIAYDEGR